MRHVSLCCATVVAVATLSAAILYPKTPAPASPPSTAPSPQRGVRVSVGQLSIHWGAKEVAAAQPPPATPSQPLNALTRTAIALSCVALAICMIGGMRLVFDEHAREIAALQERFRQALEELATDKLPQAEETNDEIEQLRATMDTHRRALRAAVSRLLVHRSLVCCSVPHFRKGNCASGANPQARGRDQRNHDRPTDARFISALFLAESCAAHLRQHQSCAGPQPALQCACSLRYSSQPNMTSRRHMRPHAAMRVMSHEHNHSF